MSVYTIAYVAKILLKLDRHCIANVVCAVYLLPSPANYATFFDYLNSKGEHILTLLSSLQSLCIRRFQCLVKALAVIHPH